MENSDFQVLLQAVIDAKDVQEQLSRINDLSVHIQKLHLDQAAINGLREQLSQKGIDLNLALGNSSMAQASKTGQQIGKLISDSAQRAIDNASSKSIGKYFKIDPSTSSQFNAEMEKLVSRWTNGKGKLADIKINTRTSFDENAGKQIERLHQATVTYKNELNEVIQKTIAWRKTGTEFDTDGNLKDIYGFAETASQYSKSLDTATAKTKSFADQQKKTVTNLSNQLKQIYRDATDPNASKPVKDSGNLASLKTQYDKVTAAINKMGSVSGSAFTDEQNKVNTLISDLKIMVKEYKNAETVATSLRSKDLATVKSQYSSKLDVLTTKMKSSGAYTKGFQNGADNLRDILASATDASGLTAFLNGLDKLDAGYKRAKASAEAFNRSQKVGINVSGLESKIADWQRISPEINSFKTNIYGADVTVQSLLDDLGRVATQSGFSVASARVNAFGKAAKAAGITLTELVINSETATNKINKIQALTNGGIKNDYSTQIAKLAGNFRNFGLSQDETNSKLKNTERAFSALKQRMSQPFDQNDYQEIISLNDRLQKELAESSNEYEKLQASAKGFASTQQRLNKANQIEAWNQKNPAATSEVIANNRAYIDSLRDLNTQMTKTQFNNIVNGFKSSENAMRSLNRLGVSFKEQMSQAAKSLASWFSVSSGVMMLVSKTRSAISEIKELDNTLTEISKTSDITADGLKELGMSAYDTASSYGRTANDYLSGVKSMSQSGFYGKKGEAMAEQSLLAQSAGDMSQEVADKYVIATNAAYKFNGAAEKINAVLDGQNSISNRNSVALEDMATAMSEAGTVASSYNVAIEDLSAMIGTMEAVTKSGGSEVGHGIKSILINLQNITSTKIPDTLEKANASMTEMVNGAEKLRNPIAILRDLAVTFNKLDEDDPLRAEILTNVAGKYQAAKLAALLQNMDMFDKMLSDYSEGAGSALEEANKSATNLTGSLNALSNSWTGFVNSVVTSDGLKTGVNLLNSFVQGITKLTNALGPAGTLGLSAGLFAGIKNVGRDKMSSPSYHLF